MSEKQTTVIEINGVKLEVDLRNAKRIDQMQIGSRVKVLAKQYNDFATYPGVIVGFEPFPSHPAIVIAYLQTSYNSAALVFKTITSETKDFEIVADLDNNALEVNKADAIRQFDSEIAKKELEVAEMKAKKDFFIKNFGAYFQQEEALT